MKKRRDWSGIDDRAYSSHFHTIEIVEELGKDNALLSSSEMIKISASEYRHNYISLDTQKEFSISTVVYVDASTYTYLHVATDGSAVDMIPEHCTRLSNADIRRPEDRTRRSREIEEALTNMGFLKNIDLGLKKKTNSNGPLSYKDVDGLYVLDYTGVSSGKILPKKASSRGIKVVQASKPPVA